MSAVYPVKQSQSASWRFLSFLGRFAVFALVIAGTLYRFSTPLAESLLPAIDAEFKWLDDTYDIKKIYVDREGADHVVRVVVSQARCIVLIDRAFCGDPRGRANASTLIGNITLPAALLMSLVLAWPVIRSIELVWRAVFLPFGLAIVWALDVPFVLWSAIWSLHVDAFAPGMFSPLLIWTQFLQSGGRLALAILLGILIAMRARWCSGIFKRAMPEAASS
jgi:hypothetical protein